MTESVRKEGALQPNVDGLSFDEVHLVTLFGLVAAVVLRYVVRRKRATSGASGPGG